MKRETNSDEFETVVRQLDVLLTQVGQQPTKAFLALVQRIDLDNSEIELGRQRIGESKGSA